MLKVFAVSLFAATISLGTTAETLVSTQAEAAQQSLQPASPAGSPSSSAAPASSSQSSNTQSVSGSSSVSVPVSAQIKPLGRADEVASPAGLPTIGLWMLRDGKPADWLGCKLHSQELLEPINVIIVDAVSTSAEEASGRLLAACGKASFPTRTGHSSGYSAIIGTVQFGQFPAGRGDTFSDDIFVLDNDHGRIFGPLAWNGAYIFVAAFSRERLDMSSKVKHSFESFNRARDAFSQHLADTGAYEISSFAQLGNAVIQSPLSTTSDHDGIAVVLSATH